MYSISARSSLDGPLKGAQRGKKDSVSKDAANKAAGLNEPKNGKGVRLRYAAKEI
jgi:hypothetical protein